MTNFDLVLLIIIFLSSLVGAFRGFFVSLLSSFGWIISLYGNHQVFYAIEPFLQAKLGSKFLTFTVGYIGGLLIFLLFFAIINFLANAFFARFNLGFFDKILGCLFGFARGLVIIAFAFFTFDQGLIALVGDNLKTEEMPSFLSQSVSLPWIRQGELILAKYLPQDLNQSHDQVKTLKIISKLISNLPPDKIKDINQDLANQNLPKKEKMNFKLQKLWNLHEKEGKELLTQEEVDLIKKLS